MIAPVEGSGDWPAWMARVAKRWWSGEAAGMGGSGAAEALHRMDVKIPIVGFDKDPETLDWIDRDGITATARVLGVDRPSLQKWTDRLEPGASAKSLKSPRRHRQVGSGAPAFVELLAASTGTATSCVVEVESASGGKLRLDLKTIATSQLAELIRAFAAL